MPRRGGMIGGLLQEAEERLGLSVIRTDERDRLQEASSALKTRERQLEDMSWQVLDAGIGGDNEMTLQARRTLVKKSRYVWMNDAQAGASVSLMNDFVFGRGVPAPTAKDKAVQEIVDDFWNDVDNLRVLTSYSGQIAFGTDLSLQSNVFVQVFDDGDDGKVKISTLNHDEVENAVRDPDNRLRVLYYVARHRRQEWDFEHDKPRIEVSTFNKKPMYYESWEIESAEEEVGREKPLEKPPSSRVGRGRIYHVAINKYSEQVFGNPEFQRLIRWYSAYNDFMKARLDIAQAAAAFIMKRKIKGSPAQLARLASQALSRRGEISGGSMEVNTPQLPPRPGAILDENDAVTHENFNLNSNAGNAMQDAQMIRAPVSAGTRFPQSYYGDATNSNLAMATSLELPVLKAVESRQEVIESMIRALLDRVIERAVDSGRLTDQLTPEEIQDQQIQSGEETMAIAAARVPKDCTLVETNYRVIGSRFDGYTLRGTASYETPDGEIKQAHEDKTIDEVSTKRDLGYEFSMPSPLRRMMGDLVAAVTQTAQTFDPNNENIELTKALAVIVFGEAFEISDPADLVEKIWPPGYESPSMQALRKQAEGPEANPFGPEGGGQDFPDGPEGNAYGAPMNATRPEQMRSGAYNAMEAELLEAIDAEDYARAKRIRERLREMAREEDLAEVVYDRDERIHAQTKGRTAEVERLFDSEVGEMVTRALNAITLEKTGEEVSV